MTARYKIPTIHTLMTTSSAMKRPLLSILLLLLAAAATAQPISLTLGEHQKVSLRGFAQGHYEYAWDGKSNRNDFNLKHVVLIADVNLMERLSFRFMPDFASPRIDLLLQEYYAQYDIARWLKVRMGQFKQPYTIENVMPPTLLGVLNMNESARYMAGVVGDPLYGFHAGRDLGLMLTGELIEDDNGHAWIEYSIGVFNGAGANQRDRNNSKDVIASLSIRPMKEVQLHFSCIIGEGTAETASPFADVAAGSDYTRNRWSLGLRAHKGRYTLRGEWMSGRDGHTDMMGGYAELWITMLPRLDMVLDIDYLNRNITLSHPEQELLPLPTQTSNYCIGLQYWIHKQCRIATQYIFTQSPTAPAHHQWNTQMQVAF